MHPRSVTTRSDPRPSLERRALLAALLGAMWNTVPHRGPTSAHAAPAPPTVGATLALPDLPLIEGGTFHAADAKDRVVVVYWWASWCPFCAEMSPSIEKLWRTQRDRGLTVLGISIDRTIDAPREYRRRRGYTFPTAIYTPALENTLPKPDRVPFLWVRDRAGRLVMVESGQLFADDVAEIARFL